MKRFKIMSGLSLIVLVVGMVVACEKSDKTPTIPSIEVPNDSSTISVANYQLIPDEIVNQMFAEERLEKEPKDNPVELSDMDANEMANFWLYTTKKHLHIECVTGRLNRGYIPTPCYLTTVKITGTGSDGKAQKETGDAKQNYWYNSWQWWKLGKEVGLELQLVGYGARKCTVTLPKNIDTLTMSEWMTIAYTGNNTCGFVGNGYLYINP